MKDELKNVLITFSLIGLAFTKGSLMYQKKIYKDYVLAVQQQTSLSLLDSKSNLSKIQQNQIILSQIKQQELPNQKKVSSNSTKKSASSNTNTVARTQAEITRQEALTQAQAKQAQLLQQQAQVLATQQQALVQVQATTQAQAVAQAAPVSSPSRQSRAS